MTVWCLPSGWFCPPCLPQKWHCGTEQYSTLLWYSKSVWFCPPCLPRLAFVLSLSSRCGLRTTIKEFLKIHTQTLSLLNFLFGAVRFSDSKDVSWFIWLMVLPKDDRAIFYLYLQGIVITGNSCNYNDLLSF